MPNYVIAELRPESSKVDFIEFTPTLKKAGPEALAVITRFEEVERPELEQEDKIESSPEERELEDSSTMQEVAETNGTAAITSSLAPVQMFLEAEDSFGFLGAEDVFYHRTSLPFSSRPQIEKVLGLHISDSLPFDINEFVIDHSIVSSPSTEAQASGSDLLVALSREEAIKRSIETLEELGLQPSIITTRGVGLRYLPNLISEEFEEPSLLLWLGPISFCCLAWNKGKLIALRELAYTYIEDESALVLEVKSFLMQLEQSELFSASKIVLIKPSSLGGRLLEREERSLVASLKEAFSPLIVREIDLNKLVQEQGKIISGDDVQSLDFNLHAPALGVIAFKVLSERDKIKDGDILNLRKGRFEYRPFWRNFKKNLKTEAFNIFGAFAIIAAFFIVSYYNSWSSVQAVEGAITETLSVALPSESLIHGQEIANLEERTAILDENLRKVGSRSKLSPLQTLRTLSAIIPPSINIKIYNFKIKEGILTFSGTVSDTIAFGELQTALKTVPEVFCNLEVSTQNREFKTNRTRYRVKTELCS